MPRRAAPNRSSDRLAPCRTTTSTLALMARRLSLTLSSPIMSISVSKVAFDWPSSVFCLSHSSRAADLRVTVFGSLLSLPMLPADSFAAADQAFPLHFDFVLNLRKLLCMFKLDVTSLLLQLGIFNYSPLCRNRLPVTGRADPGLSLGAFPVVVVVFRAGFVHSHCAFHSLVIQSAVAPSNT